MDYEDALTKLIALYAAHDVAAIRSKPELLETALGKKITDLSQDATFAALNELVAQQKVYIESVRAEIDSAGGGRKEVGRCLRALFGHLRFGQGQNAISDREALVSKRLLLAIYAGVDHARPRWSAAQLEHFEYAFNNMMDWKGSFISFTRRGSRNNNTRYRRVIQTYLDKKSADDEWDTDNILAQVVVMLLQRENIRCFFDEQGVFSGDDLEKRIFPEIRKAFVFVQLVQSDTFTADGKNWCFEEYTEFKKWLHQTERERSYFGEMSAHRFLPVLAHEKTLLDRPHGEIPPDYRPWRQHIFTDKLYVTLPTEPKKFEKEVYGLIDAIAYKQHLILEAAPE